MYNYDLTNYPTAKELLEEIFSAEHFPYEIHLEDFTEDMHIPEQDEKLEVYADACFSKDDRCTECGHQMLEVHIDHIDDDYKTLEKDIPLVQGLFQVVKNSRLCPSCQRRERSNFRSLKSYFLFRVSP